jgi:hypothetical protein
LALDGSEQLQVDPHPRLIVFGFDQDQKRGNVLKRLKDAPYFRKWPELLLPRGDSKEFRRGISIKNGRSISPALK